MNDVIVVEVGPRDGLQAVTATVPTEQKLAWIREEYAAGVRMMQVGSFVPAARMPQLADTAEVVAAASELPGLTVSALVPNLRGAQDAFAAGVHHVSVPVSASAAHSRANVGGGPDEMIERVRQICTLRDTYPTDRRPHVMVGISTAYGCSIQGEVAPSEVERLAVLSAEAGADSLSLGDTTGYANPAQVRRLYRSVHARVGSLLKSAHFHDTRGMGLANVVAALDCGIRKFDASLAGLGGCPHAPGASGNIVTEDLVYMLESMGFRTGIDVEELVKVRHVLAKSLPAEPLQGNVCKAGPTLTYRGTAA